MFNLRINLEDVLFNKISNDLLLFLKKSLEETKFKVVFWYNGKITENQIELFSCEAKKILKSLEFIEISNKTPEENWAWFDINNNFNQLAKNRHTFVGNIIEGVKIYLNILENVSKSDKRIKYIKEDNDESKPQPPKSKFLKEGEQPIRTQPPNKEN